MSKQKYYYAVAWAHDGVTLTICSAKAQTEWYGPPRFEVIPIPSEEIDSLIKKYRKK